MLWLFSVAAIGVNASPRVGTVVDLDEWGRAVLSRCLKGVWFMWSLTLGLHVAFWSATLLISLLAVLPAALIPGTRFVRGELRVWTAVFITLVAVALATPENFSLCALMIAATLVLRAWNHLQASRPSLGTHVASPFRDENSKAAAMETTVQWLSAPAPAAVRQRLLVGALFATYLATWTANWSGGPWPSHVLGLDLVLIAFVAYLAIRKRTRIALPPLGATLVHRLFQVHVVAAPHTTRGWGILLTSGAFGLLALSLAASYGLRDQYTSAIEPDAEPANKVLSNVNGNSVSDGIA
jgi:hypothetical protein